MKTILLAFILVVFYAHAHENLLQVIESYKKEDVSKMMSQIRRDGNDGKSWVLVYGDSITDGFGSSDPLKTGYANLLKMGLKLVDPTFDTI